MVNKMHKSIFMMAPVALAFLANVGFANAASNAEITITANVVPATCDVALNKSSLDLGNFSKTEFTEIAKPIAASVKTLSLTLTNCEAPASENSTPGFAISGQTLPGYTNIFNSTGTNTGIMLSKLGTTTYLKSGETVSFADKATTAADLNGQVLTLNAGLASTSSTSPDIGLVRAPVLFSFVYN